MKNVIVGNHNPKNPRYPRTELDTLLRAQIENAMECCWQPDDILLFTNFEFAFNGVTARPINLNDFCFTGSKMFALQHLLQHWEFGEEIIWMHDLDCWQTEWFDCPVLRDVGICEYSQPKLNGG